MPANGPPGATPEHGLYAFIRTVSAQSQGGRVHRSAQPPARIARALLAAGYGDEARISVACRLLLPDEQLYADLSAAQAASVSRPQRRADRTRRRRPIANVRREDDEYVQRTPDKGRSRKQEARALSLAKLRLAPDAIVWDIGAGSGSVGIEASRLAPLGHVYAIEKNEADAANAPSANALRFRASNCNASSRAPSSEVLARPRRGVHRRLGRRTRFELIRL